MCLHAYHHTLSPHSWLTLLPTDMFTIQGGRQGGWREEKKGRSRKKGRRGKEGGGVKYDEGRRRMGAIILVEG